MPPLRYRLHGFTPTERAMIERTLADPRGWSAHGVRFRQLRRAPRAGSAPLDFEMHKTAESVMDAQFPTLRGLSVTVRASPTQHIHMHASNWNRPPAAFTGSRAQYRQYLVNHEVGHVLGLGHERPDAGAGSGPSRPCPVMYQQTRGTRRCRPNPWPEPPGR